MKVMLYEAIGTRYVIDSLSRRFQNVCEECIITGNELDVAECSFALTASLMMREYYGRVKFVNSTNEELNAILLNNYNESVKELEDYPDLEFKEGISLQDTLEMIQSTPTGKYTVKCKLSDLPSKAGVVMFIMARPDVELDIRLCCADIYDFVREVWLSNRKSHTSYTELRAPHIITRVITEDGTFGDLDCGYCKEDTYVNRYTVLPSEFGKSQLIILGQGCVDDEWSQVLEKCINIFSSQIEKKRTPGRTVKNFLKFREDD